MQQDNKPDNQRLISMTKKPPRVREKGQENEAQEFINETENVSKSSTAERGHQPRVRGPLK